MRNFQLFSLLILAVTLETHYALLRGQRRHVSQDDEFASDLSHRRFGRMLAPYSANAGTMTSLTSSTSTTTASTTTPRNMFSLTASPKLGNCGNPCYKDTDCVSGLVCFQRTVSYQGAPGCPQASWNPYLRNYCVNATLVLPPPSPRPTAPPTAPPRAPPTPRPTPPPTLPLISVGRGISSVITDLKARLLPYSLNGGAELADTNTYQSRAVTRMAEVFGMQQVSDAKLVQFYVLYCIFEATNGVSNHVIFYDSRSLASSKIPGWIVSAGWISTESDISLLNPCKGWHGITCDSNDKITAIQLSNNRLTGSFPPEVVWLASDGPYTSGAGNLNRIDLNKNQFLTSMDGDTYWWWLHLGSNFGTNAAPLKIGYSRNCRSRSILT